jgi:outer membrane cobalamin receptor
MKKFLVLCCFVCGYAFSQIYETTGITVVGRRLYDGSLQTGYYGAAQVITSADIQAVGALTVPDVLQKYGIAKYSNGTGSPIAWTLNWNGFAKGQETVVIVDGIKINEPDENDVYWQNIPVTSIERIEIIPGAGSAQYGSGAFAGVLNIVTNKTPRRSVFAEAGSYGYGRQGFAYGNIFADNFYYNLDFDHLAGSGQRKRASYEDQRFSAAAGYFDESKQLNFYYKTADAAAHYPVQLTEDEIKDNRWQAAIASRQDINTDLANIEYIHRLNADWTYVLNFGARQRAAELKIISKAGNAVTGYQQDAENSNYYLGQITYKDKLSLGYDYRLSDIRSRNRNIGRKLTSDLRATKGEYAPYIQYFDHLGPVYLRYGVREDSVDYVQTDNLNKSAERKTKKFSKRAHNGELGWDFIPDWQVYYSYGEAFKAPTFYNLYGAWPAGNIDLSAELAKQQAAGLRWQNNYTNFNWNIFQTIVDDEIIGVGVLDTMGGYYANAVNQNAQKTSRSGFNLNIEQKIRPDFQVFANYNYTKAHFLDSLFFDDIIWNVVDAEGYVLPQTPEQIYSYGFTYVLNKYSLDLVHNFVAAQYAGGDITNDWNLLPAYSFTDARINYNLNTDLNIYLSIHNLLNNVYSTKSFVWYNTSDWSTSLVFTPADLRTAAIGAQWSF